MKTNCNPQNTSFAAFMQNRSQTETKGASNDFSSMMNRCMEMMNQHGMANCRKTNPEIPEELSALFNEWCMFLEDEVLEFYLANKKPEIQVVCDKFKLSNESVEFLLDKLRKSGKLN